METSTFKRSALRLRARAPVFFWTAVFVAVVSRLAATEPNVLSKLFFLICVGGANCLSRSRFAVGAYVAVYAFGSESGHLARAVIGVGGGNSVTGAIRAVSE